MNHSGKTVKMLVLGLTGQCNFACKYCYAHQHPQAVMRLETAVKAIDLAGAGGKPFILQFTGGEPLLAFPVMREILAHVHQQRIPAIMQLQTNASLVTPEMAAVLKKAGVGVGISLDGRPAINDLLRQLPGGAGTSRCILSGISHLADQGIEIGITCVVSNENAGSLAGIVEMAYYLGNVRRIGFDLLRAQGRGRALTPPPAQALRRGLLEALQTARKLEQRTGRKLLISQLERVETLAKGAMTGFAHCHAMNGEAVFVDAQGALSACASLAGDENFRLGHVDAGIDQARLQAVSANIQASMAFCNRCRFFPLCGGGCFARWHGVDCCGAYEAECALKQAAVQWFQDTANRYLLDKSNLLCNT